MDGIIPLAVKRVAGDVEVGRFLIGDDDALWIDVFIQFATDGKACCGRCGGDEVDNHAIADERLSLPVH